MTNTQFKPKLTPEQRDEIFEGYIRLETCGERWGYETRMAEKYGIHRKTVHRITHDEKRIKKYLDKANHIHNITLLRLIEHQTDAVNTRIELMNDKSLPQNLWYLRQNAAVDVMNRAGLKDKEAEESEIRIVFGEGSGMAAGMPASDDDCEDE